MAKVYTHLAEQDSFIGGNYENQGDNKSSCPTDFKTEDS